MDGRDPLRLDVADVGSLVPGTRVIEPAPILLVDPDRRAATYDELRVTVDTSAHAR